METSLGLILSNTCQQQKAWVFSAKKKDRISLSIILTNPNSLIVYKMQEGWWVDSKSQRLAKENSQLETI